MRGMVTTACVPAVRLGHSPGGTQDGRPEFPDTYFGVDIAESALCTRCDCTLYGTDALMAVDAGRALEATEEMKSSFSSIQP